TTTINPSTAGTFTLGSISMDASGNTVASLPTRSSDNFVVETRVDGVYVKYLAKTGSASTSTVTGNPSTLRANAGTQSTITVQLKNGGGATLTASGGTVTFASLPANQGTIGSVTDNGNGTYTATYTVGTYAGNVVLQPKINGINFTNTLGLTVQAGAPTVSNSTVAGSNTSLVAGANGTSSITIQLKDVNGNNLTFSDGTISFD
ncbi:MAG: Ig-like domain-containing protein, partial [Planctomycetia bacterium]